jgi:3-methyladenine DNA glycosylase AlkD
MTPLSASHIAQRLRRCPPSNTSAWRALRCKWTAELSGEPPGTVVRIAEQLVSGDAWHRLTAYELIEKHPGALRALNRASIRRLSKGLSDWPGVDTFGCCVAGPAWREGQLGTHQVNAWARSPDRWQRRLALVCTVALNVRARGGRGDTARTLGVCRQLIEDRDDMVVKALSWALRSLVRWDRPAVRRFIRAHDDRLAARVKREVGTKLSTGRKNVPRRARRRADR